MRRIKYNHGCELPSNIFVIVADARIASVNAQKMLVQYYHDKLAAVQCVYRDKWTIRSNVFDDCGKLWDYVSSRCYGKRKTMIVVMEPYLQLDLLEFWKLIEDGRVRFATNAKHNNAKTKKYRGTICMHSTPFFMRFLLDGKSVVLVAIENYLRDPEKLTIGELKSVAKSISEDVAESRGQPDCMIRALILSTLLRGFVDNWRQWDVGCWQPTASKLAMNAYRHYLAKHNLTRTRVSATKLTTTTTQHNDMIATNKIPRLTYHDNERVKQLEREAYFGGEAQAFFVGRATGEYYLVDRKSYYPWICLNHELPYELVDHKTNVTTSWLLNQLDHHEAIARVEIVGPNTEYPCRIITTKIARKHAGLQLMDDSCVVYPEGKYVTTLCGPELREALDLKRVSQVFEAATYKKANILGDFMREWLERRKYYNDHDNMYGEELSKMIANSLVGKFGQRSPAWIDKPELAAPIAWGEYYCIDTDSRQYVRMRSIGGHVQQYVGLRESRYSFVALPAVVTSIGRHIMRHIRRSLPERSVYLQDTDSLLVDRRGYDMLASDLTFGSGQPGSFSLKLTSDNIEIWTPKHYRIGPKLVLAGIPQARIIETGQSIIFEVGQPYLSRVLSLPHNIAIRQLRCIHPEILYSARHRHADGWTSPHLIL